MKNIYEMLQLDLAHLTDKNEKLCSTYMAIMRQVVEHCEKTGRNVKGVKFGIPRVTDNVVKIDVKYD